MLSTGLFALWPLGDSSLEMKANGNGGKKTPPTMILKNWT